MASVKTPTPPPAPTPVDPGQSALAYTRSMADPELQKLLYQTEAQYRPQYAALNLADINTYLLGGGGQKGALDLQDEATRRAGISERAALASQREADIAAVEQLGGRATAALRAADPYAAAIADQQQMMAKQLYASSQGLTPEQQRIADQQARMAGLARGRIGDQSSVAAEILGREGYLSQKRQEAQQAGQLAFGMNRSISADPFQAILGRPASAMQYGTQQQQFAAGLASQPLGPRYLDPNAGINLAMQNQANLGRYQTAIYGSRAGVAGANAQASGAMIGGLFSGLGSAAGGGFFGKLG